MDSLAKGPKHEPNEMVAIYCDRRYLVVDDEEPPKPCVDTCVLAPQISLATHTHASHPAGRLQHTEEQGGAEGSLPEGGPVLNQHAVVPGHGLVHVRDEGDLHRAQPAHLPGRSRCDRC